MNENTIRVCIFTLWLACVAPTGADHTDDLLVRKLNHLEASLAVTSSPSLAFDLSHEIESIKARIRERGKCCCGSGCKCTTSP